MNDRFANIRAIIKRAKNPSKKTKQLIEKFEALYRELGSK